MKKFQRQAQSQRKHGPLSVSSASKAPPPAPRGRPEWAGSGYVKKSAKKVRQSSAPQGPIQTIQEQLLPAELQQFILDIFRDAFPASLDFEAMKPILQEINNALVQRDFGTAFGKEEFLEAYAIRWSPSRALALSNLLAWLCEQRKDDEWIKRFVEDDKEKPAKALCFGGGAAEIMAFAGLLRQNRKSAVGKPNVTYSAQSIDESKSLQALSIPASHNVAFSLALFDTSDWSLVVSKLYDGLTTIPKLSKYASTTARALNASFLSPQALNPTFKKVDILDLASEDLRSMVGPEPALLTLFFVLNDLYSSSIRKTTSFLRKLSTVVPSGSLLLVVDGYEAAPSGILAKNCDEQNAYPMSWLLNKAMLPTSIRPEEDDEKREPVWEKVIDDANRLYKLPEKGLRYPASLENIKNLSDNVKKSIKTAGTRCLVPLSLAAKKCFFKDTRQLVDFINGKLSIRAIPMFEVRHAGAKGFGIFASRCIPRGSRILAERALLSINNQNTSILAAARQLSPIEQKKLLCLSLNGSKQFNVLGILIETWQSFPANVLSIGHNKDILNIFCNNNFALSDRFDTRAVFPTVARINHSCVPNSQGNFNERLGSFTVHATRDIAEGEEVTISYLHNELSLRNARQAILQEGYGFQCGCDLCAGATQKRKESRERRSDLQAKLKHFIEQQYPVDDPETASNKLALTQLVIDTHEYEGLAGRGLASLYSSAAGLAMMLGNRGLASMFGARGLELERDAVGDDSPFYEASLLAFSQMRFGEGKTLQDVSENPAPELSYAPWT